MKNKKILLGREYLSVCKLISGFISTFFHAVIPALLFCRYTCESRYPFLKTPNLDSRLRGNDDYFVFHTSLSQDIGRGKNLCFFLSFVKREGDFETFVSKSEERFNENYYKKDNNNIKSLAAKAALPLLKGGYCGFANFFNYKLISEFYLYFFPRRYILPQ
jgi:hypothetical protein